MKVIEILFLLALISTLSYSRISNQSGSTDKSNSGTAPLNRTKTQATGGNINHIISEMIKKIIGKEKDDKGQLTKGNGKETNITSKNITAGAVNPFCHQIPRRNTPQEPKSG